MLMVNILKCSLFEEGQIVNKTVFKLALATLVISAFLACSPSVKKDIDLAGLDIIPLPTGAKVSANSSSVFVDLFSDGRDNEAVLIKGDKKANLKNDPGDMVRDAITGALKNKGFVITDTAPLIISGEVKKLVANVEPGFPVKLRSDAKIILEVFDPANEPLYKASYNGFSSVSHPSINSTDVKEALGLALKEAVTQVVKDKELIGVLESF